MSLGGTNRTLRFLKLLSSAWVFGAPKSLLWKLPGAREETRLSSWGKVYRYCDLGNYFAVKPEVCSCCQ